jgi:hypothetical protein
MGGTHLYLLRHYQVRSAGNCEVDMVKETDALCFLGLVHRTVDKVKKYSDSERLQL